MNTKFYPTKEGFRQGILKSCNNIKQYNDEIFSLMTLNFTSFICKPFPNEYESVFKKLLS